MQLNDFRKAPVSHPCSAKISTSPQKMKDLLYNSKIVKKEGDYSHGYF